MGNINNDKIEGVNSPSTPNRKTSDEEQRWWDALYMYVKNNILELDPKLNLNKYTILRLRGMAQGCFVGQDVNQYDLTYGYKVVLAAFDRMAPLLKYGLQNNKFKDMKHKINWMFAVVEPHLNEVYQDEALEKRRLEQASNQSDTLIQAVEHHQQINHYVNSDTEFKTAKPWDKKHQDMW